MNASIRTGALALAICAALPAHAVTINIVNADGPGEGFNDPTPVAPVAGNPATTLGAQRLYIFRQAAAIWGARLSSTVPINVRATFDPLTCSTSSAVLGQARPADALADFPSATSADTSFPSALANARAGRDLNGTSPEIIAQFNSSIDSGCAGDGMTWWYGMAPSGMANRTDLLPVVLHELAHGLGFTAMLDTTQNYPRGVPSAFAWRVMDTSSAALGSVPLGSMTPAQIRAAAVDDPYLVWGGIGVYAHQAEFLGHAPQLALSAKMLTGSFAASAASFGPTVPTAGVSGNVVAAVDASDTAGMSIYDACSALTPASGRAVAGNIALVDRGSCAFVVKVVNAQNAGARAVLIANNAAGLVNMGGTDPRIVIPVYGIEQTTGASIRSSLASGVTVPAVLGYSSEQAGTHDYVIRMNAPATFQPGSSISHWTPDASPDLLMEPANSPTVFNQVDLTAEALYDIGWDRIY